MHRKSLVLAVVSMMAAGCATTPCDTDEPYHRAVAYPYLEDAPGVKAPEPTEEFRIPESSETVEFARADAGAESGACNEVPAPLPEFEETQEKAADPEGAEQG